MPGISGACLCGSVRYSSTADAPDLTAVCHCTHCQKQTGTAFSVIVGIPESSLTIVGGENCGEFLDTGDSGGKVQRRFCRNCGSPILTLAEAAPGAAFIKAGTLDDPSWLRPTIHIWCDSAQPWFEMPEEATTFPGSPTL
jgi:hypothetical protein